MNEATDRSVSFENRDSRPSLPVLHIFECIPPTQTPPPTFLLSRTAAARFSSTSTVVSHPMHASVMLTPFFNAAGPPSAADGTFWFPSCRFDSIMTPTMADWPARSWSAMAAATLGWLLWFFEEFPGRKGIIRI